MAELKHTPPPWLLEPNTGGKWIAGGPVPHGGDIICDAPLEAENSMKQWSANARLICAAPELLNALQLLHDNLAEYQKINNLGGFENGDMKMARAAIEKATGESYKSLWGGKQ